MGVRQGFAVGHLRDLAVDRRRLGGSALAGALGAALGIVAAAVAADPSDQGKLIVAMLMGSFAVAIVGDLRRVLLGVVLLNIPFQWDLYFGYREDIDRLAALAGWGFSAGTLALAGLYAMWIVRLLISPETAWRPRLRAAALPATFVGVLLASLAVAQDRVVAGFQIAMYAEALLLLIYLASTVRTRSVCASSSSCCWWASAWRASSRSRCGRRVAASRCRGLATRGTAAVSGEGGGSRGRSARRTTPAPTSPSCSRWVERST